MKIKFLVMISLSYSYYIPGIIKIVNLLYMISFTHNLHRL